MDRKKFIDEMLEKLDFEVKAHGIKEDKKNHFQLSYLMFLEEVLNH